MESAPLHLTPASPHWPEELREIDGPPDELWARGEVARLAERPRVAIVGTRAPTPYGQDQAERFAFRLASLGISIVSGLARGIDQCAHRAALAAGGTTLAVLGSGVDRPWPECEEARTIVEQGVLLSELPPGRGPRRHHFPRRNRLISGLAEAVLVIEAAAASGSLITARWAADQGRTVFALPGRVDHPMARGCHRLLREGATLVESPEEVIQELRPDLFARALRSSPTANDTVDPPAPNDPLVRALTGETLTADELSLRTRLPVSDVLSGLIQHELAGVVTRSAGGLFRLVRRE